MRQVIPASIREDYVYWKTYMHEHVDFSHGASVIHTKAHCERVLLYALILARKRRASVTLLCIMIRVVTMIGSTLAMGNGLLNTTGRPAKPGPCPFTAWLMM